MNEFIHTGLDEIERKRVELATAWASGNLTSAEWETARHSLTAQEKRLRVELADTDMRFSGDWEIVQMADGSPAYQVAYEAVAFSVPWNGWATPLVEREVAEAFVARQQVHEENDPNDENDRFTWVGDRISVEAWDGTVYYVDPDQDGRYFLGDLGYTFERVRGVTVLGEDDVPVDS